MVLKPARMQLEGCWQRRWLASASDQNPISSLAAPAQDANWHEMTSRVPGSHCSGRLLSCPESYAVRSPRRAQNFGAKVVLDPLRTNKQWVNLSLPQHESATYHAHPVLRASHLLACIAHRTGRRRRRV